METTKVVERCRLLCPRRLARTGGRQGRLRSSAWLLCFAFLPFTSELQGFPLFFGGGQWARSLHCDTSVRPRTSCLASGSNANNVIGSDGSESSDLDDVLECSTEAGGRREKQIADLKVGVLKLAAAHDRGFGAGPRAREQAVALIQRLERLNVESFASRGIDGSTRRSNAGGDLRRSESTVVDELSTTAPLAGCWKMIWTTAWDVLSLEASPFTKTAAIYQVYDPPTIANVIDVLPKVEAAFPPSLVPSSLLRLQVETQGASCPSQPVVDDATSRNRILLEFRSVQIRPMQLLGAKLDVFPPLTIGLPGLPRISSPASAAATSLEAFLPASILNAGRSLMNDVAPSGTSERMQRTRGGYFDVTYLDEDFLVIRQQGSRETGNGGGIGGLFVLIRVDSIDP